MTKKSISTVALAGSIILLASTGILSEGHFAQVQSKTASELKEPKLIRDGSALFARTCASSYCHGSGGKGGGAPRLRPGNQSPSYLFKTVSDGVSGSPMIAFRNDLSEDKIWSLVAFILSPVEGAPESSADVDPMKSPEKIASESSRRDVPPGSQSSEAVAGKELFYELSSRPACHFCHSVHGVGGQIGPELSNWAKSAAVGDLSRKIASAHDSDDPHYRMVSVELKDGDKVFGIKISEDAQLIRVYDVVALPPVLRTIQKADVSRTEPSKKSVIPSALDSIYSEAELRQIIAFLKSS